MLPRLAPGLLAAVASAPGLLAAGVPALAHAADARAPRAPAAAEVWRRGVHGSAGPGSPQYGGYMFTGRGAFQGDPDPQATHKYLVTGACGQIGAAPRRAAGGGIPSAFSPRRRRWLAPHSRRPPRIAAAPPLPCTAGGPSKPRLRPPRQFAPRPAERPPCLSTHPPPGAELVPFLRAK